MTQFSDLMWFCFQIGRLEAVVGDHSRAVEGIKSSMGYAMPALEAARKSLEHDRVSRNIYQLLLPVGRTSTAAN